MNENSRKTRFSITDSLTHMPTKPSIVPIAGSNAQCITIVVPASNDSTAIIYIMKRLTNTVTVQYMIEILISDWVIRDIGFYIL